MTFHFADGERGLFGSARIGILPQSKHCTALALLFSEGQAVAAELRGGLEWTGEGWESARAGGLAAAVEQPLERWSASFDGDQGGFDLSFAALGPAVDFTQETEVAALSGTSHYEHICSVEGSVRAGGRPVDVRCHGLRTHAWGAAAWDALDGSRAVCAIFEDGTAVSVNAVRPRGAAGHDTEALTGYLVAPGDEPQLFEEVRLSVVHDAERRPRAAGLELYQAGDEYPRRCSGELVCGTSVDLGELALDATFFRWHMAGQGGYGRFDAVTRSGDRAAVDLDAAP